MKIFLYVFILTAVLLGHPKTTIINTFSPHYSAEKMIPFSEKLKILLAQNGHLVNTYDDSIYNDHGISYYESIIQRDSCDILIWTRLHRIDSLYLFTAYTRNKNSKNISSYKEEIRGTLSDVLTYSVYNIAMKILKKPDRKTKPSIVKIAQPKPIVQDSGWLVITAPNQNEKMYLNGNLLEKVNYHVKVPTGTHKLTLNGMVDQVNRSVEIFKDAITRVSLTELSSKPKINYSLGINMGLPFPLDDAGPHFSLGAIVDTTHYFGMDCIISVDGDYDGGGLVYTYRHKRTPSSFLTKELGITTGYWSGYEEDFYTTGIKSRLLFGKRHLFFNLESTVLFGNSIGFILISGMHLVF